MYSYFSFGGQRSYDFGLRIESAPTLSKPKRKVELISIPGRNGNLRVDQGGFENVSVTYKCSFRGDATKASEIVEWLYAAGAGYAILRDSYFPGVFRLGAFDGPIDIVSPLNRAGRCNITFDCRPEVWLDSGNNPMQFSPTASVRVFEADIFNPTLFDARPLIRVLGNGSASININDRAFSISSIPDDIYIDCDMRNAYRDGIGYNDLIITPTDFPILNPGHNRLVVAGVTTMTVTRLEITPRWWRI